MYKLKNQISYFKRKLETYYINFLLPKNKTLIVITGCGRSGTTFSTKLLDQMGLRIGHERFKRDGVSSWFLVSQIDKAPLGPSLKDLKKHKPLIIHQVREPLAAISSMQSLGSPSWRFLESLIPISLQNDSKVLLAMKYYYYWNLKTEEIARNRVKVEDFGERIKDILDQHNIEYKDINVTLNQKSKVNTRLHSKLSWDDLYEEDRVLAEKIKILGKKYNY